MALVPTIAMAAKPFEIAVVDDQTGRGVPLVELETVNQMVFVTDSNGIVAFDEPGLLGERVFFYVRSHGYEFPKDGFGYRGVALETSPGERTEIKIRRVNLAQRLYRITGQGIYRDSVLVGREAPLEQPLLNAQVLGSDSVLNAVYRGKLYWFWGDTNRASYPLGNFDTPGATSRLPSQGGLHPAQGVNLEYFVAEDGFAKKTAPMPGSGPTWITSLVTLHDQGREQLFASYVKVDPPLEIYAHGLAKWNDDAEQFEQVLTFAEEQPLYPDGHTFVHGESGQQYVYFSHPFPLVRVGATEEALQSLEQYQAYTCLLPGSTIDRPQVDRTPDGQVRYGWRSGAPLVGPREQDKLIRSGHLQADEVLLQLRDRDSGKKVLGHHGSVYWNAFRNRWVMITVEQYGTSFLGEVWYAEADSPVGPWVHAVKIVTHDKYSFYNPKQHPMFDQDGGRVIFFEGTYTNSFSGNPQATPRYEYNQIMYQLDLDDERLALPAALYRKPKGLAFRDPADAAAAVDFDRGVIAFFALDRSTSATVPIYTEGEGDRTSLTTEKRADAEAKPLFHALPVGKEPHPATAVPLLEFVSEESGKRFYTTDSQWSRAGFAKREQPVCYVWPSPWKGSAAKNAE